MQKYIVNPKRNFGVVLHVLRPHSHVIASAGRGREGGEELHRPPHSAHSFTSYTYLYMVYIRMHGMSPPHPSYHLM